MLPIIRFICIIHIIYSIIVPSIHVLGCIGTGWQWFPTTTYPILFLWMGMQENWATTLYFLIFQTNSQGFFYKILYEFHAFRFESLDLPPLPADRSDCDAHGALKDEQVRVQRLLQYLLAIVVCNILYLVCCLYILYML